MSLNAESLIQDRKNEPAGYPPRLFFFILKAELSYLSSYSILTACNVAIKIRGIICLDLHYTRKSFPRGACK